MKINIYSFIMAALALSVVPSLPGQVRSYSYDFEADTLGIIFSDSATYNYSADTDSSVLSAGGTLTFRGNSPGSDYDITSIGGSQFLRIQGGLNTQTDDFGVYIGGLDFSDFGSGDEKEVSFSFDILGNSLTSSTDWEVNYSLASSVAGHGGFLDDDFTGKTTFSFANSGSSATTVTGTFSVLDGEGSILGGLFISGPRNLDGSAALTGAGGSLALDNISVTITAIPEPSSIFLLLGGMFAVFVIGRGRFFSKHPSK